MLLKYTVVTERIFDIRSFNEFREALREHRVYPRDVQNQLERYDKPIVWESEGAKTIITVEEI